MANPVRPLLASAVLLAVLAVQAGAEVPASLVQVTLGESAATVNKALGHFDVLSRIGGPSSNPMETFLASGLEIELFRGKVKTITVRHASPSLRADPNHKIAQAIVSMKRVGAGDAVPISIGETAHAVHLALGGFDSLLMNGPLGSQTENYLAAGLSVQYFDNKVAEIAVMRFAPLPKRFHTANTKFKQAVVLVPGA